ncbi:TonB-dependent receptor domain-containing protein, partial [Serratia marcescens]|uniref:TonB-dependent receptor domain-containing protein n=1 Tax=Serratia marcescens TaxID=615 RepID=UPI0013D9F8DE
RSWGAFNHQFVYGATIDYTRTSRPRSRYELNLTTGTSTTVVGGETFPNKNFPDTATTQAAAYIQDTIQYGALRVIPAIRFDYYHLQPNIDAA